MRHYSYPQTYCLMDLEGVVEMLSAVLKKRTVFENNKVERLLFHPWLQDFFTALENEDVWNKANGSIQVKLVSKEDGVVINMTYPDTFKLDELDTLILPQCFLFDEVPGGFRFYAFMPHRGWV